MKSKKLYSLITLALLTVQFTPAYATTATTAVTANDVTIVNNIVGTKDTVTLKGSSFTDGDVIKVYSDLAHTKQIGTATANGTDDVVVSIDQIGQAAGNLYVTNTSGTNTESSVTTVAYTQEVTPALDTSKVTVTNNVDIKDTVDFTGLKSGEKVTVYNKAGSTALGTATAASDGTAKVTLANQLTDADAEVEVSGTITGAKESTKGSVSFTAQAITSTPSVTVTNNVDISDEVKFTGLKAKDVATVFAKDGTTKLGTATASADGDVTIKLAKQLSETDLGIKVTVKSYNKVESAKTDVSYSAQAVTTAPVGLVDVDTLKADTVVTNNVDIADTVTVKGLKAKDIVTVYDSDKTTKLGTATASKDGDVTVTLTKKLSETTKKIYVNVKTTNKMVSPLTELDYDSQAVSLTPSVTVTNNVDIADTVTFTGLKKSDIATVYAKDGTTKLGTATASADGDVTIKLAKQLSETDLAIKASVKSYNKEESVKADGSYSAQAITSAPIGLVDVDTSKADTVVTNNVDTTDTVTVKGLKAKDIVTIYGSDKTTKLGTATASKDGDVTVTLAKQLNETTRKIYVTVKTTNKLVSAATELDYNAQVVTDTLSASKMFVTNNALLISGLSAGDKISVYALSTDTKALTTVTVAKGSTYAVVTFKDQQAGTKLYVTNKSTNKMESAQLEVTTP